MLQHGIWMEDLGLDRIALAVPLVPLIAEPRELL